jgi:two-component system response regulator PilR (NtrC family)
MEALRGYSFPGNVRELENILERAFTLCEDNCIEASDLHFNPAARRVEAPAEPPAETTADTDPSAPLEDGEAVTEDDSGAPVMAGFDPSKGSLEDYLEDLERQKINEALEATRWNKTAAAKRLGITFRALRYRLKKLGLE